jgi:hypothetical protein
LVVSVAVVMREAARHKGSIDELVLVL